MKKTDSIVLTTAGVGLAIGIAVWIIWPGTPWFVYAGIATGTLIAIPNVIKTEAEQKLARKILDE